MANPLITDYTPPASVVPFFTSDKFANFIVGPYGSTKTTASLMKIAYEAMRVRPGRDGVRRSRCAVVRNTRQMLFDTTIPDFLKWFPDGVAGTFEKTNSKFILQLGSNCECEVLFRGLDDANDVRRLLSLQLSFGMMDEFREIHPDIYEALAGRVGRYPDGGPKDDNGKPIDKLWGASNPPDMDTFWEELLTSPPENVHVTIQPSALSPEADWLHFLKDGYYDNLAKLHASDPDWIDVYIHSKFGKSLSGKPVFRSFRRELHVAKSPLMANPHLLLIVGLDPGMNTGATIMQQNLYGQITVLDEIVTEQMGAARFADDRLLPLLRNKYRGLEVLVVPDPAADNRSQADELTVVQVLRRRGLKVKPAMTNNLEPRLSAVDGYLNKLVDGQAALLIDPGCTRLIKALAGGYKYEVSQKGKVADTPRKDEHSHIADALQYGCLYFSKGEERVARLKDYNKNVGSVWRPASHVGY